MSNDIVINEFQFNGEIIDIEDILVGVDTVVDRISQSKDANLVAVSVRSLIGMQKLSGIALSKLLWSINNLWPGLGVNEELPDFLYATTGLQRITVERYINIWNMFASNSMPESLKSRLLEKPMKSLIVVANALSQGYEISDEAWNRFATLKNESEIRSLIREEKDQPARKNALTLYLSRDGSLEAWTGDGRHINVGFLNVEEAGQDEMLHKAITRIINSTGIILK